MTKAKLPAKVRKSNVPGKERKLNKAKIKSSSSLTSLLNLGDDLDTIALNPKPTEKPVTNKEKVEIQKFEKLWGKVDRIRRARSISTYKPMPRFCTREGKKENIFLLLLREYNVCFSNFVKSVQSQSPWIPNFILDKMCHSIQMAAFEVGWSNLLGDNTLIIQKGGIQKQRLVNQKLLKQSVFRGSLQKLERFRTSLTHASTSRKVTILLPMLQRAGTRILSNFKAITANGDAPYDELSAEDLAQLTGYKKAFFQEIGRPCIAVALFDAWLGTKVMASLIKEIPKDVKFKNTQQRALKQAARKALKENEAKFRKCPFYSDISQWVFPSAF